MKCMHLYLSVHSTVVFVYVHKKILMPNGAALFYHPILSLVVLCKGELSFPYCLTYMFDLSMYLNSYGIFLIPWRVGRIGPLAKGSEKCIIQ